MGKLRYIYAGDKVAAQSYIGEANKQHLKLRNSMRFQDLKIGQRSLQFTDGAIITNTIVHGIETATIYVPEVGGWEEEKELYTECYCDCNFTVGTVVAAEDYENLRTFTVACCVCDDAHVASEHFVYDHGKKYTQYYWLRASDYTPWEVGMGVVLLRFHRRDSTLWYSAPFRCCYYPYGDDPHYDDEGNWVYSTGCTPNTERCMEDTPPDPTELRSQTFIILPICMSTFPKWIKKVEK